MSTAKKLLDHKVLSSLSPLCDLTPDMLTELSAKSRLEEVVAGATIFKAGDRDHRTLYLMAGKLELIDAQGKKTRLAARSKQAREPLDPSKPRSITAIAKTPVTLLNIDTELMEMLLGWGENSSYVVSDIEVQEEETDWMSRYLQSKVFLKLRAENIQALMMRMEEIDIKPGEVVIRQGSDDKNYYIIAKGLAQVMRQAKKGEKANKLATLNAGTGFGEEALIGNSKRNASVVMAEGGKLMKLAKNDFIELLVEPILQRIDYEQAKDMQGSDVIWLDVRDPEEFAKGSQPGAKNIPLGMLRMNIRKLNKLNKYLVLSKNGDRAAAAAFLLCQQGLDAYVIKDGVKSLAKSAPVSKQEPAAPAADSDNVVPFKDKGKESGAESEDSLVVKARQRVQQEMQRAQAAENARRKAQEEVERLKAEAEAARKQAEIEAKQAADKKASEEERLAAQQRAEELAKQQAEREEAVKRAEAEAARAELAEAAKNKAEAEIERLKGEAENARREAEDRARQMAENARKEAEKEIERLKSEMESAKKQAEEQARLASNARSEEEREQARLRAEETNHHQHEVEEDLKKAVDEAKRVKQEEETLRKTEVEAEKLRIESRETQLQLEAQVKLAADDSLSEAKREAARQRAEALARKHAELEEAVQLAGADVARARSAETEVERLKQQAEEARKQAEEQARLAADAARSETEREMARSRAEEMIKQQAERELMLRRAEEEARRAKDAEDARLIAEAEIRRLKVDAEVARMQLEEQAERIANAARSDAEREAARARAAEEARLQAEEELERLEREANRAREEAEEQARLAADKARSEAEREAARIRAEELARQQAEFEEIARKAEQDAMRAQLADEARQRAEREIARRELEAEEAARKAADEARRAEEAESARMKMEEEIARMKAEAEKANEDAKKKAADDQAAMAAKAKEEADRARQEAEEMRRQSEDEIKRLKAEAEAARLKAELEIKRTLAETREKAKTVEEIRAESARKARQQALSAMDLGDTSSAKSTQKEEVVFNDEIIIDEVQIDERKRSRDNLIDPTAEAAGGSDAEDRKRQWVSDDHLWEATLGYRTDPDIKTEQGPPSTPTPEVTVADDLLADELTQIPEPVESGVDNRSTFEAKEVSQNIRPKVEPVKAAPKKSGSGGKGKWLAAAMVLLLAGGGGGWFFLQGNNATGELSGKIVQTVEQGMGAIKEQVNLDALLGLKDKLAAEIKELTAKMEKGDEVDAEKMANLKKRLEEIKAKARQAELEKQKRALEEARRKAAEAENRELSFEEKIAAKQNVEDNELDFEKRLEAQVIVSETEGEINNQSTAVEQQADTGQTATQEPEPAAASGQ